MALLFNLLTLIAAGGTGILYWFGISQSWLWYYPWIDNPLHLAGGLAIGLWGVALSARRRYTLAQTLAVVLLLAVAVGSVWEIFEVVSGLSADEPGYWFDTLKDMGNDTLGALAGWVLYALIKPKPVQ